MGRYIDVDRIPFYVRDVGDRVSQYDIREIAFASEIKNMPTADVVEVRHGYWEAEVKHFFDDYGALNVYALGHCSECGKDYPFNPTLAREYISRPENLIGYEHWDIDVEPIKIQVANMARRNKNLYPYCPECGAKMDAKRSEENL